jgi:hypothetical protein
MRGRALPVPWATAAICALVIGCGAPAAAPPAGTVAPPAWAEGGDARPEIATTGDGGIACGDTRCDDERPHCCHPMGQILDTSEPLPEPSCVADHTQCSGTITE